MSSMSIGTFPWLSFLTFVPLLGAVLLLFFNRNADKCMRWFALVVMLVDFIGSLVVFFLFDPTIGTMQLPEQRVWVSSWGISYKMGIDGISLFLVLLTTLLGPIVIMASWTDIKLRVKES